MFFRVFRVYYERDVNTALCEVEQNGFGVDSCGYPFLTLDNFDYLYDLVT